MGACPAADALSDLAAGKLPADSAATLHHHLRGCEACAAALAAIGAEADPGPQDDALVGGGCGVGGWARGAMRGGPGRAPRVEALGGGDGVGRLERMEPLGMGSMGAV